MAQHQMNRIPREKRGKLFIKETTEDNFLKLENTGFLIQRTFPVPSKDENIRHIMVKCHQE